MRNRVKHNTIGVAEFDTIPREVQVRCIHKCTLPNSKESNPKIAPVIISFLLTLVIRTAGELIVSTAPAQKNSNFCLGEKKTHSHPYRKTRFFFFGTKTNGGSDEKQNKNWTTAFWHELYIKKQSRLMESIQSYHWAHCRFVSCQQTTCKNHLMSKADNLKWLSPNIPRSFVARPLHAYAVGIPTSLRATPS